MKIKAIVLTGALLLVGGSIFAQSQSSWGDRFRYEKGDDKFFANEFSLDAFATYNKGEANFDDTFDHSWRHGRFGGGVGLNWFVTRYIGSGVDTYFNDQGVFAKNIAGSLILRYPMGDWAPYIFGGVGGRFSPTEEWTYHGGVGFEVRFNPRFGFFSDVRYTVAAKTTDEVLMRAGFRFGLNK